VRAASGTEGTAGFGAVTFTAPLRILTGDDLECWVQNLGPEPVDVSARLVDNTGSAVTEDEATVAAGHTVRLVHSSDDALGAYCRFAFDGGPAEVRGSIVLDDGTPRQLELAALAEALTPFPTPTATRTRTSTRTATPLPSATPTATVTSTIAFTPTATVTPTVAVTTTNAPTATATPIPTSTVPSTPSETPDATPSASPTEDVAASTPTPSPPASVTATSVASPTSTPQIGFPGDANCDGIISAADLVAAATAIESALGPVCGADANGDGGVDAADVDATVALIFGG